MPIIQPDEDYSTMTKIGMITMWDDGTGVRIEVSDFEYSDHPTCRGNCAKTLAWARDVLINQVEHEKNTPGGAVKVISI